jgi:hypothetical protein
MGMGEQATGHHFGTGQVASSRRMDFLRATALRSASPRAKDVELPRRTSPNGRAISRSALYRLRFSSNAPGWIEGNARPEHDDIGKRSPDPEANGSRSNPSCALRAHALTNAASAAKPHGAAPSLEAEEIGM